MTCELCATFCSHMHDLSNSTSSTRSSQTFKQCTCIIFLSSSNLSRVDNTVSCCNTWSSLVMFTRLRKSCLVPTIVHTLEESTLEPIFQYNLDMLIVQFKTLLENSILLKIVSWTMSLWWNGGNRKNFKILLWKLFAWFFTKDIESLTETLLACKILLVNKLHL